MPEFCCRKQIFEFFFIKKNISNGVSDFFFQVGIFTIPHHCSRFFYKGGRYVEILFSYSEAVKMNRILFLIFMSIISLQAIKARDFNLINKVADRLNNVLNYISANYDIMNLDGIFGVVFAKAHLNGILNTVTNINGIIGIDILSRKCDEILENSIPMVESVSSKHKTICNTIMNPKVWNKPLPFENKLLYNRKYTLKNNSTMNEDRFLEYVNAGEWDKDIFDECFLDLFEMQTHFAEATLHNCSISNYCRYHVIDNEIIHPGYGVTHRLLYLQAARSQNCNMDEPFVKNLINSFCSYIYWEITINERLRFIPELDDLLLEQVTLCGYEGFPEFFSLPIIEHIINIQTRYGCFTVLTKDYGKAKREANLLKDGCYDHTTGLGASTLSLILRYLMGRNDRDLLK